MDVQQNKLIGVSGRHSLIIFGTNVYINVKMMNHHPASPPPPPPTVHEERMRWKVRSDRTKRRRRQRRIVPVMVVTILCSVIMMMTMIPDDWVMVVHAFSLTTVPTTMMPRSQHCHHHTLFGVRSELRKRFSSSVQHLVHSFHRRRNRHDRDDNDDGGGIVGAAGRGPARVHRRAAPLHTRP